MMESLRYNSVEMPVYQGIIGSRHVLVADWHVDGVLPDGRCFYITVKKGFIFDGASIPRALWRLCGHPMEVPRVAAALAHDWIYASHAVDRKTADAIYREICRKLRIIWLRRSVEYRTLRLVGGAAWYSHGPSDVTFARSHGAIEIENERKNK
jgi:hypothetical protein